MTTELEQAKRLEAIRDEWASPEDGSLRAEEVGWILAELGRMTAERDEDRFRLKAAAAIARKCEQERDDARAEVAALRAELASCTDLADAKELHRLMVTIRKQRDALRDLAETAWGVIANAGWRREQKTPGWDEAAARWRDCYHALLEGTAHPEPKS